MVGGLELEQVAMLMQRRGGEDEGLIGHNNPSHQDHEIEKSWYNTMTLKEPSACVLFTTERHVPKVSKPTDQRHHF